EFDLAVVRPVEECVEMLLGRVGALEAEDVLDEDPDDVRKLREAGCACGALQRVVGDRPPGGLEAIVRCGHDGPAPSEWSRKRGDNWSLSRAPTAMPRTY